LKISSDFVKVYVSATALIFKADDERAPDVGAKAVAEPIKAAAARASFIVKRLLSLLCDEWSEKMMAS
jgi:hypothetical protein